MKNRYKLDMIFRVSLILALSLSLSSQSVYAAGRYSQIDKFNKDQSEQFAPSYLHAKRLDHENLVDKKNYIEDFIQSQNHVGKKDIEVPRNNELNLKGPRRGVGKAPNQTNKAEKATVSVEQIQILAKEALATYTQSFDTGTIYEEAWRINCGATFDYADPSNKWWVKDEDFYSLWRWGYAGGSSDVASTIDPIAGTDLQAIFQTNRWGDTSYKIDMPNGDYKVTLMFAETYFAQAGQRVFDIALEGNTIWHNVDIFSWSGGHDVAMELNKDITVSDAVLDIAFPQIYMDNPLISGIKVEALNVDDDSFLDFIEKKMFWFFYNDINPGNGLVKWGDNNWAPGYSNVSSIASDGFALSLYTVGVERGWITEDDAYQKTMTMLDTFDTRLENVNGFWYHLVYMSDNLANNYERAGQRAGGSEVSTVDSALFIMGALQAGEYFKAKNRPEVAVKANSLYSRMNWKWFTGIPRRDVYGNSDGTQERFVNMGWKPETDNYSYIIQVTGKEGFFCNDWWNRYSESVFVDLLALGSPDPEYVINYSAWYDMTRWEVDAFGYHFIQEPPLFTHQYHNLYFDFTDQRDIFADYFLNTQKATLANRETTAGDPRYEPDRWGLTGCGGPPNGEYQAYGGYPGGSNDGTVAPTAAITSLMFTQDESMDAARFMYFKYKDFIWGKYGFSDSFNLDQNYRNQMASALNNGAMLLGIENYRSGLIMDTFMNNQYIQNALAIAGFMNTPGVVESSYENTGLTGENAFDGNLSTRWSSRWVDTPQWLERDFKTDTTFNKITINWETAYAKTYKIQVSDDRINWTDIYFTDNGNGGTDEIIFPTVTARYVRMYATERGTEWGYSIYEMKVENDTNYYALNMPEIGWYESSGEYNSTGAAACQMILNYIREGAVQPKLLDQDEIYEYAKGANPYGPELTPDEISRALGHFDPYDGMISNWADIYDSRSDGNPYQGYNYSVDTHDPSVNSGAMDEYMRGISHWIAYTVTKEDWWRDGELVARPNTPAVIPLYGSYNHWAIVIGFVASANPAPNPHTNPFNIPDFDVYGFWIYDPLSPAAGGIGQNVYITAAELISTYLKPVDAYGGLLLQIAEPPLV